ncbi:MAG: methyltransferase domain-containing protein [Alphaproteobacteria bacterium]|nr:methyltransferase domain-containing protein [Alphaproteobacteria bacterium]
MRIIGGKYRGKKLFSPLSENVRPTSDRSREAIFNILRSKFGNNFSHLKLLDIFCGTGAFSLEAISQGFAGATSIDMDISSIQKNAKLFPQEQNRLTIIKSNVKTFPSLKDKYDILFMDAPYNQDLNTTTLLSASGYLNTGALCIIETHKNEKFQLPTNFKLIEERIYGISKITFASFSD